MQFCKPHWESLRQAIKDRGLWQLVANSGEEAATRMKKELEGQAVVPDPLMEAHNMIFGRSLNFLGMYIMATKEDGTHYCPLCEAKEKLPPHPDTKLSCDESWIETLADYLKKEYTKEGWLNDN